MRRLIGRFPDRRLLSACYEAGPGGYELHRLLTSMGVACDVVAPSLIPKGSSDRVKTDRRDSVRLALSHRAGLLTAVRVPSPAEEAVRDLVRARADLLDDRKRMQQRLNAMLLRHGRIWRGSPKWTYEHRAWVDRQVFDEPALAEAVSLYRGGAGRPGRRAGRGRGPVAAGRAWSRWPPGGQAGRLPRDRRADRPDPGRRGRRLPPVRLGPGVHGLHRPHALGVFQRRAHPPGRHHQGRPAAVRSALIEAAWSYRHRPAIGATLRRRQAGCAAETLARSWKAQQRLHATYTKLTRRGKPLGVASPRSPASSPGSCGPR